MASVCLPSNALLQHLPSYLGFSYLGRGVSLHGCSSKAQLLLLTLDKGYLLTTTPDDLERGVAPLGPPVPAQPPLLGRGVAPPGRFPWPLFITTRHLWSTPLCSTHWMQIDGDPGAHKMSIPRLIIFFAAKDGEALYSQQKQDQELTVSQIMNSLLPNSDFN